MARRSDHSKEELKNLITQTAREIVQKDGFTALTARNLAQTIGYTPRHALSSAWLDGRDHFCCQ